VIDTVVKTDLGQIRGHDEDGIVSFRGVPYAAAPDGPLRFQPPAPAAGWDGVRDCLAFGSPSPQVPAAPGAPSVWRPTDGLDCLTLNVWSPDLGAARLPVMVWIHGGLWKHGWTGMAQYDGAMLTRAGVVVVTVNYRLGFEGFGHLPGVPDNRGLRDQIAALAWVRRNIAGFGGDPDNITVFGQSAGAASTALLVAAPAAGGLFHRAIAQSIPDGYRSPAEAERVTAILATAAGVAPTRDGFARLAPEAILAVQDAPLTGRSAGHSAFGPVVDGDLVTGPPWAAMGAGAGSAVDLICGFTHEEGRGIAPGPGPAGAGDLAVAAAAFGLAPAAADAYRAAYPGSGDADLFVAMASDALVRIPTIRVAEAHAQAGGRTWLYDFAWPGPALGAAHGVDVPFTFGTGDTRYAARFIGSPPPAGFAALSEHIRTAWTAFAATGEPGWPGYDLTHRLTRIWDTTPRDVADPIAGSRRIWLDAPLP
jgi:para-nitrobenzyl esterase